MTLCEILLSVSELESMGLMPIREGLSFQVKQIVYKLTFVQQVIRLFDGRDNELQAETLIK